MIRRLNGEEEGELRKKEEKEKETRMKGKVWKCRRPKRKGKRVKEKR